MKYFIILALGTCAVTFAYAQKKATTVEVASIKKPVKTVSKSNQLYLLSTGDKTEEITKAEFKKINKKDIEYVKVLKDAALLSMYGDKGKNGVVLVVMKVAPGGGKRNKHRQG